MPEAIPVLDDPYAITITDEESDPGEQRFVTLGMAHWAACLWSSTLGVAGSFRIISARPAEAHEREEYEA